MEDRIAAALQGRLPLDNLTAEEHDVWLEAFDEKMASPSAVEKEFFAERRRRQVGVGLSKEGIVIAADGKPSTPNSEG